MNESELKKHIDNLIIDGLIKEAEQDDADFRYAMKHISDEDFNEIVGIREPVEEDDYVKESADMCYSSILSDACEPVAYGEFEPENIEPIKKSSLRPWIVSILSAVVISLVVFFSARNYMDRRLCASALYASKEYVTATADGIDVANAPTEVLKKELPGLESRYLDCITIGNDSVSYSDSLRTDGWNLVVAYLRLNRKQDALDVLEVLSEQYSGTDFGNHCLVLISLLD